MILILALSGVGMGCFSHAKVEGKGYSYEGRFFESPIRTARAHAIATDAETRRERALGNLEIRRIFAMSALQRQELLADCLRKGDADCVLAIQQANLGYGGYVGMNGWGAGQFTPPPHTLNDGSYYNY